MFAEMLFFYSQKVEATRMPGKVDSWRLCEGMDIVWNEVLVLATKWIHLDNITELKEANQDTDILPLYKFSGVGNRDSNGATRCLYPNNDGWETYDMLRSWSVCPGI